MNTISTRTHAILDFTTAGVALFFPRILGSSRPFRRAVTALALGKIGYALFTRHEGGIVKAIPMRTHLILDSIGGATLAALPFLMNERKHMTVVACALGLGAFDIAAAPMTEMEYKPRIRRRIPSLADTTTHEVRGLSQRTIA